MKVKTLMKKLAKADPNKEIILFDSDESAPFTLRIDGVDIRINSKTAEYLRDELSIDPKRSVVLYVSADD